MLTDEELQSIKEEDVFANLSTDLQKKIIKMCVAFMYVTFTDPSVLYGDNFINTGSVETSYVEHYLPYLPNSRVSDYYSSVVIPCFVIPDLFKKYSLYLTSFGIKDSNNNKYRIKTGASSYDNLGCNAEDIINCLMNTALNPYVLTAYLSRECALYNNLDLEQHSSYWDVYFKISDNQIGLLPDLRGLSASSQTTKLREIIGNNLEIGNYVRVASLTSYTFTIERSLGGTPADPVPVYTDEVFFVLYVNGKRSVVPNSVINFNLDFSTKVVPNVKTRYFDTVLTFSPYDYYTVSLLGRLETMFNKLNYYEQPLIKFELSVIASEFLKYVFTPTYVISDLEQKYYSEGFEQTFSNALTLKSDKLAEYLAYNSAQMKAQYSLVDVQRAYDYVEQAMTGSHRIGLSTIGGYEKGLTAGGISGFVSGSTKEIDTAIGTFMDAEKSRSSIKIQQASKLADMGAKPDSYKQVGTDISAELNLNELGLYLNHYKIDEVSYNSICKYLERFGYCVNIYDEMHVTSRVGWDFVKLVSFDFQNTYLSVAQEESIRQIFAEGVTLLHDKSYMTSGHNYETILEGVIISE